MTWGTFGDLTMPVMESHSPGASISMMMSRNGGDMRELFILRRVAGNSGILTRNARVLLHGLRLVQIGGKQQGQGALPRVLRRCRGRNGSRRLGSVKSELSGLDVLIIQDGCVTRVSILDCSASICVIDVLSKAGCTHPVDDSFRSPLAIQVSPSSPIINESNLPLSYFDLPYLIRSPPELLFFYTFPNIEITQFMHSLLPQIKQSLSQTLNHYYPLAGNLIWPQQSNQPFIRYSQGDHVKLTVAQTNADFNHLSGYHSRDPKHLQKLVPLLTTFGSTSLNMKSDNGCPVFALQITLFPSFGISLGTSFHHCAIDGRSTTMFLKSWASVSRSRNNSLVLSDESLVLPFIDKSVMKSIDSRFKKLCLQELVKFIRTTSMSEHDCNNWLLLSMNLNTPPDQVMATFEVLGGDIDGLKRWVSSRTARPNPSRFELVCAFIWVCLAKAKTNVTNVAAGGEEEEEEEERFEVSGKRSDLVGQNGIVVALDIIMKEKRELGASFVRNVEERIASNAKGPLRRDSISGSPQFRFYELDFGWGRPVKVEFVVVARTGSIFFADSRNGGDKGGIEISLARSRDEMEAFRLAFVNGLSDLRSQERGVKSAL
ncbi:hypothetical protein Sjap_007732 [Stephania japonica]|uniref:Uncharacterized protein n=1 Tax=Stephania japonica TaxID=461633 RepID=A0AAP0PA76_9MAGN